MKINNIIIILGVVIIGISCAKKSSIAPLPTPQIEVYTCRAESISNQMEFIGQTFSNYDVTIQPRISGYLLSTHYKKGMPVKKGQLLIRIDPSLLQTKVNATRAALASAEALLIEANNNYQRAIPLARINAISQSSLDQYAAQYASAEASLKSAASQLRNAEIEVSYATIYSPINGVINQTNLSVGDYVGVGTQLAVLNTIANIDSITAEVSLPVAEYLNILERNKITKPTYDNSNLLSNIELRLSDGSLYPHKGRYRYTNRDIATSMGTITIVVVFPNPDKMLKVGQYAKITTNVGSSFIAVLVPQRCVSQTQGTNSLWVMSADSSVKYRRVTLGDTYSNMWVIKEGLAPGEKVLTSGQMKMHDGMKIIPLPYTTK